jgi:hypothetical protein
MKNWKSFESKGIETDSDLAKKLWRVSQILKISPFDKTIMELNAVQINFILRMYSADHPDEFKIIDKDLMEGKGPTQVMVAWSNKFCGKTKEEYDRNPILFLKKYYDIDLGKK